MKHVNYKVYQINNGDYVLITTDDGGSIDYYHTYDGLDQLKADVEAIKSGDVPAEDWDGNADNNAWGLTAQELYDQIKDSAKRINV
jgi:hypothetical protein